MKSTTVSLLGRVPDITLYSVVHATESIVPRGLPGTGIGLNNTNVLVLVLDGIIPDELVLVLDSIMLDLRVRVREITVSKLI